MARKREWGEIMKKMFVVLLAVLTLSLTACGGRSPYQKGEIINDTIFDQFVIVKDNKYDVAKGNWYDFYIVYDKDTKVMYYLASGFNRAMMSPIYNSDGTVKIWDGE